MGGYQEGEQPILNDYNRQMESRKKMLEKDIIRIVSEIGINTRSEFLPPRPIVTTEGNGKQKVTVVLNGETISLTLNPDQTYTLLVDGVEYELPIDLDLSYEKVKEIRRYLGIELPEEGASKNKAIVEEAKLGIASVRGVAGESHFPLKQSVETLKAFGFKEQPLRNVPEGTIDLGDLGANSWVKGDIEVKLIINSKGGIGIFLVLKKGKAIRVTSGDPIKDILIDLGLKIIKNREDIIK